MDEQRFDNVTRAVAAAMPRRSALAAIGGGFAALATLGRALAQDDATPAADEAADGASVDPFASSRCKNDGKKCKKDKDCCSGTCKNKACKSSGGGSGKCKYGITYGAQWGGYGSGYDPPKFNNPLYVTTDTNGNAYVTDSSNYRVMVTDIDGKYRSDWGTFGNGLNNNRFNTPTGIAAAKNSNGKWMVYVADAGINCVKRFNVDSTGIGTWKETWGPSGSTVQLLLNSPYGVAVGKSGTVYIADTGNSRIRVVYSNGDLAYDINDDNNSRNLNYPRGVAVIDNGDASFIVVADTGNDRLVQYDVDGNYVRKLGSTGSGKNQFNGPSDVSVDKCGNVWVADTRNNRVVVLDKKLGWLAAYDGSSYFKAGSGASAGLKRPTSVNVDKNSNLFVVDSGNNRVFHEDIN